MVVIRDIREMIRPDFLRQVTLTDNGTIPLFGNGTPNVVFHLLRYLCRANPTWTGEKDLDELARAVEHHARIGAYMATVTNTQDQVYEFGCGIGIPSLTYALLTDNPVTAIDKDDYLIDHLNSLKRRFTASFLEARIGDARDSLSSVEKTATILMLNPADALGYREWDQSFFARWPRQLIIGGSERVLFRDATYELDYPKRNGGIEKELNEGDTASYFSSAGYPHFDVGAGDLTTEGPYVMRLHRK